MTDRIAGRWIRTAELPAPRGLRRWRAVDDQGNPVEVVELVAAERSAQAFLTAHRALATPDPAVAAVYAVLDHPVAAVREPLHEATLHDLSGTLPPGTVAELGARLLPVLLERGVALGGTVLPADLGVDATGRIVLAPMGPVASRVERGVLGAVAPEVRSGGPADGQAALYALGAVLYRLATGRLPPVGAAPPPPSSWNHRVGPELDRAIVRLLSPTPGDRPGALPDLVAATGVPEDPRPLLKPRRAAASQPPTVAPRATTGPALVVPATDLAAFDPRGRSIAAGLAGVPVVVVEELARAGLPLVLARGGETTASAAGAPLPTAPVLLPRAPAGWAGALGAVGLMGSGVVLAGVLGLAVGPLAALVGAAMSAVGLAWAALRWSKGRSIAAETRALESAWTLQEAARADRERWPAVAAIDRRIARFRVDLAHADLPDAAERDLRDHLKEIEGRLEAALGVLHTAERALASVDRSQLALRLQTLSRSADPADRTALDQVVRTTADLADVEERRDRQLAIVAELGGALDELAASLADPEAQEAHAELARAARTAQLLRDRRSET